MKEQINITERDIFTFVFNPQNLPINKKEFIESNIDKYQKQIDYCSQLKKISAGQIEDIKTQSISERILNPKSKEFLPVQENITNGETNLRLAAAGIVLEKKSYSKSFKDDSNESIIKIVSNGKQTLLYYFSEKPLPKAKLTLLPSGATYTMMDTSHPIEIMDESEIEKVVVEKT
ncbi:MAG: hypothetical protein KF816_02110 [Melioribacteraceae bacterium]|nr:hypothetical protein [Melioribacteraceae bacterium]